MLFAAGRFYEAAQGGPYGEAFASPDAAYVLSYSVMMLNTDLHHPDIKEENRMTLKQFQNNLRGVNGDNDLDPKFLEVCCRCMQLPLQCT